MIFHNVAEEMVSFDQTAVALGIPAPRRQEIKANYPNDEKMRKIGLLEVWKRARGDDATYLALVEAFLKMNDRQTAGYIVTFVKQQINPPPPDQGTEEIQGHEEREQEQKGNYAITTASMGLGSSRALPITKGVSSPQGREGMQLVIIKNYMNIFIFHK